MRNCWAVLTITLVLFCMPQAYAQAGFNVGANVCAPNWQCTAFSQVTCGTRTCIDSNACGVNTDKPSESITCPPSPGGGGGSRDYNATNQSGYLPLVPNFIVSTDIIKVEILQGQIAQRNFVINALESDNITISVQYPENFSGKGYLTFNENRFRMSKGESKEIAMFVDAKSLAVGTSVLVVNVVSSTSSKSIVVIVNVNPQTGIFDFSIEIPLYNKIIDKQSELDTRATFRGLMADTATLQYSLIGSDGKVVFLESKEFNMTQSQGIINYKLPLPLNLKSGYYILSVNAKSGSDEKSRYEVFAILPSSEFQQASEKPGIVELEKQPYRMSWPVYFLVLAIMMIISFSVIAKVRIARRSMMEAFVEREKQLKAVQKKADERNAEIQKKLAAKTRAKKKGKRQKILERNSDLEHAFVFMNGITVTNLEDMLEVIKATGDEVFQFHAKTGKNDFSNWVRDVFKNKEVADKIESAETREELIMILEGL